MEVGEYIASDMKCDMDLIRELLTRIESDPRADGKHWLKLEQLDIGQHSAEEVRYQILLLSEAGFIKADFSQPSLMPRILRLTWEGHEFLDDIRDPDIWEKTKERLKGLTSVGIAIFGEVAKAEIKKKLGLQ